MPSPLVVHLVALRRLANETAQAFDKLRQSGVPTEAAEHHFACSRLRERLDEERAR